MLFLSILLVTTLPLSILAQQQAAASETYTSSTTFQSAILNSTNFYRTAHNASSLTWNDTLADFAETVTSTCEFSHSGGPYGENLASGYPNATAAVEAWGHEGVDYDFGKGEFGEGTGHFTQLVWKATTTVGCARKECKKSDGSGQGDAPGWFVVCEYWPRGNLIGNFTANVQAGDAGSNAACGRIAVNWAMVVGALVACGLLV